MDKEDLIKFEEEIAELFNGANISAPVHLYHGNEDQIINVFKTLLRGVYVLIFQVSIFRRDGAGWIICYVE